jgi:septum formation topological specificity factor MinE
MHVSHRFRSRCVILIGAHCAVFRVIVLASNDERAVQGIMRTPSRLSQENMIVRSIPVDAGYESCDEEAYIQATKLLVDPAKAGSSAASLPSTPSHATSESIRSDFTDIQQDLKNKLNKKNWLASLLAKLHAAWKIFFPDVASGGGARGEAAKRLRVILVADRVGLTPACIESMTEALIATLSQYVDIPDPKDVQVALTEVRIVSRALWLCLLV